MSERGYFEKRTAIPGYTFILLVIVINYEPLRHILTATEPSVSATFGAFLAFVTLLGGSAIGYLVSQIWWRCFQKNGAQYCDLHNKNKPRKPIDTLIKKYSLASCSRNADKQKVLAVYGYVVHSEMDRKGMKEVVRFTTRRWDLYHLFSSTRVTLWVGLFIGVLGRLFFETFLFKFSFLRSDFQWPTAFPEILVLICVVLGVSGLHRLFGGGRDWVNTQYDAISEAIVRNSEVSEDRLRMIFPDDYFRTTKVVEKKEWICKLASDSKKAEELIENGFEYVITVNGKMLFRKRK